MIFYDDLKKSTRFLDSLGCKINSSNFHIIVSSEINFLNKNRSSNFTIEERNILEGIFNAADLLIAGISRMKVVGPIFVLNNIKNNKLFKVIEYYTDIPSDDFLIHDIICRDLENLAIYLKHYNPEVESIILPFKMELIDNEVYNFEHIPEGLKLNIKKNTNNQ